MSRLVSCGKILFYNFAALGGTIFRNVIDRKSGVKGLDLGKSGKSSMSRKLRIAALTILAQYKRKHTSVEPVTSVPASNGYGAGSGRTSLQLTLS